MSTLGDKINIFDTLKIFTSFQDIPKIRDEYDLLSLQSDNNDVVAFLVDILVVTGGFNSLEEALSKVISKLLDDDFENSIKTTLKNLFINYISDKSISNFINKTFTISILDIDPLGDLQARLKSNFIEKSLNAYNDGFLQTIFSAIDIPNTTQRYTLNVNSVSVNLMNFNFDDSNNTITISIDSTPNSVFTNISEYINFFIDSLDLINTEKIMTDLLNTIFNITSKDKNENNIEFDIYLDNIINSIESNTVYQYNRDNDFEKELQKRKNGSRAVDFGCSNREFNIDEQLLTDTITNIVNGSTNTTTIRDNMGNLVNSTISNNDINNSNVKNNIYLDLIKKLLNVLIKNLLFTVPIILLFLLSYIEKENITTPDVSSLITGFLIVDFLSNKIECLLVEIKRIISEELFVIVKKIILKLSRPVIERIIKELFDNYLKVNLSLIT